MRDYLLSGIGYSLFVSTNQFNIIQNPKRIQLDNSNAGYFLNDQKKANISLIGGVNSTRAVNFSTGYMANLTMLYQNWSRRFDVSFNNFSKTVLYKMHPSNSNYTFKSLAFQINLWHRLPS